MGRRRPAHRFRTGGAARQLEPTIAIGVDHGLRTKLRQNRLNLNFTYDPKKEINGAISQDGPNVFNSVYEANLAADPRAVGRNLRGVGTLPVLDRDTRTRSGNGFVFEAVDNPSRAFRRTDRVSCPTGYESNRYPDVKDCSDRNAELFKPIAQDGGAGSARTTRARRARRCR